MNSNIVDSGIGNVLDSIDPDENHFNDFNLNSCSYTEIDKFVKNKSKDENDLSILRYNIRS